jgi:hypothetical protein
MLLGKDDTLLFVTSPNGVIISFKSPIQTTVESSDFHMHCVDITKVSVY